METNTGSGYTGAKAKLNDIFNDAIVGNLVGSGKLTAEEGWEYFKKLEGR